MVNSVRSEAEERAGPPLDQETLADGRVVRRDQPWNDAALARVYDLLPPFQEDLPLYLELASATGGRVLEVGCGSGRLVLPLALAGNEVVGIDASPHMLSIAKEKLRAASPEVSRKVTLARGDMRSFRLDREFDVAVLAVRTFSYLATVAEQLAALSSIAAHLRPGGVLALDLLNPSPAWLLEPAGSLRQDLFQEVSRDDLVVTRTETVVGTDLAAQVRTIRSAYEIVSAGGEVRKRFVEWAFRYTYRFEVEHLLRRAGFDVDAVHGGYRYQPFDSDSNVLLVLARLRNGANGEDEPAPASPRAAAASGA